MGGAGHDAIIAVVAGYVMTGRYPDMPAPDVEGFRSSLPEEWRRLVIGPVKSVVNGYQTFAFLPDGSREDHAGQDRGDEYRRRFTALFDFAYEDGSTPEDVLVISARFGGEAGEGGEARAIVDLNPHVTVTGDRDEEPGHGRRESGGR